MKLAISKKNIWERTPGVAKILIGSLMRFVPLPWLIGRNYRKTLHFIENAQWWSKEENQAYQLAQLQRICKLAYKKTKFYRELFDECGFDPYAFNSFEQFAMLPFIDRSTICQNIDNMCTISTRSPKVDYITTGGTTGAPLCFYTTSSRSQIEFAYLVSGWGRCGYVLGKPVAVLRGRIVNKKNGFYHDFDPLFNNHYYSSFHLTEENMLKYIEHIRTLGPCYLHVYPSSIYYLARFMNREKITVPSNIQGILAESENVYSDQKQFVEELFMCRYFSSYGHTEKLVSAVECEYDDHYHFWPTYGYFELIDESGDLITTKGKRGEIVGTGFINDVVPFIRYRTGDFATFVGSSCKRCGRNHIIVKDIRGHNTQETLIANDGSIIPWSAINMHDDTFDNIVRFQFYQDSPGYAILKIIPSSNFGDSDYQRIISSLEKKFDGRIDFKVVSVKNIPLSSSGKSIFVDQNIINI